MPLLISTGASYRGEILQALREAELWKVRDVILLQCVSLYPAQPRHYNLAALDLFRPKVGALGLSDHTLSDKASLLALARGYTWFEKHFAPLGSEEAASPDHVVSLFPDDFASWVGSLREAEAMLGPVPKAPLEEEFAERTYARRGADGLRPAGEGLTRQEYGGDDPESEVEEMVI
jgi:N-acetylneuraminate synthase/N,N'-diacetyllegionaminate synthase